MDAEVITGIHAVEEALAGGEPLIALHVGAGRKNDPATRAIIERATAASVPIHYETDAYFRRYASQRHQHVAALAHPFRYAPWSDVRDAVRGDAQALVVVLDHLEDPHNVGAVIRNAECAGAVAAVIADRRSALVTPAVRRAAAGAASHLRVACVPNLARSLEDLKADGCWVYGLSATADASAYADVDYGGRCVFVVGAEGKGISRLISQRCDRLIAIPLAGKTASLNASSAVAIALFEALRQRTYGRSASSPQAAQKPVNP